MTDTIESRWPINDNVEGVSIHYFSKTSDLSSKYTRELVSLDSIFEFFERLYILKPIGGGKMKKIGPDTQYTSIEIKYKGGKVSRISIFGGNIQLCDTSFYTNEDDLAKNKVFTKYIESLLAIKNNPSN